MDGERIKGSLWQRFTRSLKPGTSHVDWCEPNYVVNDHLAEYYNTVTNSLYLIIPFFMMFLFRHYSRYISPSCHLAFFLLIIVGLGSAYFHGALSLAGQLIDELAILWVIFGVAGLWAPRYLIGSYFANNKRVFQAMVLFLAVLFTWMGCLYPVINHIILMFFSVPIVYAIYTETRNSPEALVQGLGARCCITWAVAFSCWISDRTMCGFWTAIGFPYLHGIWHVIMVFAAYDIILFLAYTDTAREYTKLQPELRIWPRNAHRLGVMYISFKSPLPTSTDSNYNKIQ